MEISYNNKKFTNDQFIKPNETQNKPKLTILNPSNKLLTLVMYDPDAYAGTHIHWMVTNIKDNDISTGNEIMEYVGPAPRPKTGKHRYIFELFEQPQTLNLSLNKRNDTIDFIKKTLNLKNPISKIKFISQNDVGGKRQFKTRNLKRIKTNKKSRSKRIHKSYERYN